MELEFWWGYGSFQWPQVLMEHQYSSPLFFVVGSCPVCGKMFTAPLAFHTSCQWCPVSPLVTTSNIYRHCQISPQGKISATSLPLITLRTITQNQKTGFSCVVCDNTDRSGHCAKWISQTEKDKYCMVSLILESKKKVKCIEIEYKCECQGLSRVGGNRELVKGYGFSVLRWTRKKKADFSDSIWCDIVIITFLLEFTFILY